MAIDKNVLDELLAGRDPKDVFAKDGLLDDLKKALAERVLNAELDDHLEGEAAAGKQNRRQSDPERIASPRSCGLFAKDGPDRDLEARSSYSARPGRQFRSETDRALSAAVSRLRREDRLDICARDERARDSGTS